MAQTHRSLNAEIAQRVRSAARAAGVSDNALAQTAGIAERTFRRRLTGNSRWETDELDALATALGVDLALLMFGEVA